MESSDQEQKHSNEQFKTNSPKEYFEYLILRHRNNVIDAIAKYRIGMHKYKNKAYPSADLRALVESFFINVEAMLWRRLDNPKEFYRIKDMMNSSDIEHVIKCFSEINIHLDDSGLIRFDNKRVDNSPIAEDGNKKNGL